LIQNNYKRKPNRKKKKGKENLIGSAYPNSARLSKSLARPGFLSTANTAALACGPHQYVAQSRHVAHSCHCVRGPTGQPLNRAPPLSSRTSHIAAPVTLKRGSHLSSRTSAKITPRNGALFYRTRPGISSAGDYPPIKALALRLPRPVPPLYPPSNPSTSLWPLVVAAIAPVSPPGISTCAGKASPTCWSCACRGSWEVGVAELGSERHRCWLNCSPKSLCVTGVGSIAPRSLCASRSCLTPWTASTEHQFGVGSM
jgi:hypothetical protein